MSTIKVTTIQDTGGGNSSTSAEIYSGRCKAWVIFNGYGTVSIRADFNVNTVTDNGTGVYTVNFSSSLASANYACVGGSRYAQNGTSILSNFHDLETTSNVRIYTVGSAYYDCERVDIACFL